jgi:hypothetical protein
MGSKLEPALKALGYDDIQYHSIVDNYKVDFYSQKQ